MKVISRPLGDLAVLEMKYFHDSRGYFNEAFRQEWMKELQVDSFFLQDNHSRSGAGVLRGLHYQMEPPQGKLVHVVRGRIWDVAVDVRRNSINFGKYFGIELSDTNGKMLWVPPGFAHGFCVVGSEPADVIYKVTGYYNSLTEKGIRWNDSKIGIDWPLVDPVVSEKDLILPSLDSIE